MMDWLIGWSPRISTSSKIQELWIYTQILRPDFLSMAHLWQPSCGWCFFAC
jgi:hypothetical protein